jgi:hypothetical protein
MYVILIPSDARMKLIGKREVKALQDYSSQA